MGRAVGFIAILIAVAIGGYLYMQQTKAVSPGGVEGSTANPRATIDLAGVRNDLIAIANSERGYFALNGKYATLDELKSGGGLSMVSERRGPFTYSVEVTGDGFKAIATNGGPAVEGVPSRMWIDQTMNVQRE